MSTLTMFQVSIEFMGAVVCIIALFGVIFVHSGLKAKESVRIELQVCCLLLMVSDMLAWIFNGQSGTLACYMVRISNFVLFATNCVYMSVMPVFLWQLMRELDEKMPKRIYVVMWLSLIGLICIVISQFTGIFYYIDGNNVYHRGDWYILAQAIPIVGIALSLSVVIQYGKRLEKQIAYAAVLYFVLPTIATVLMLFQYGFALQNFAVVISTQIMFAMDMIDASTRLNKSQAAYDKANYAAHHDPMTGICNKTWGMTQIRSYIENMDEKDKASLCFIDIDDFKSINDKYGHITGDYWIKEVAGLLYRMCRNEDIICRFGGDEYLILLKGIADTDAMKSRVFQLNEHLKLKSIEQGQEVHCSVGVCMIKGDGHSVEQGIELADAALYEVKRGGKGSCVIYQLGGESDSEPDKHHIDIKESFNMQELVYGKLMRVFNTVVHVKLDTGEYLMLKDKSGLGGYGGIDANYKSRIHVYIENVVTDEYKNKLKDFMSVTRIRNQKNAAESIGYVDVNGRKCMIHTLIDTGNLFNMDNIAYKSREKNKPKGNNSCVIALQIEE